jgi:hypothetical protein
MKYRIAVLLSAALIAATPLSAAKAAETCIKLSLPNQSVCSSNGFVYQTVGEKFTKVFKVERKFVRPEDRRSPLFSKLSGSEFRLVFVGYMLTERTAAQ